jgi:hypothetical protein
MRNSLLGRLSCAFPCLRSETWGTHHFGQLRKAEAGPSAALRFAQDDRHCLFAQDDRQYWLDQVSCR